MVRLIDCYFEIEPKYWVEGLITKAIVVWFFNPYDLEQFTGKNNGFPFLDILGYLKNTHKNPKFGKVRHVPIR